MNAYAVFRTNVFVLLALNIACGFDSHACMMACMCAHVAVMFVVALLVAAALRVYNLRLCRDAQPIA